MSKKKVSNLSYIVIGIGVLSCTVFAYFYSQNLRMENIVKEFWQLSLDNKMDEADILTAFKNDLKVKSRRAGPQGVGDATIFGSGTGTDEFYRKYIYERQVKIHRISEVQKKDYRAGVRVETTDKDNKKLEFIACLGEVFENNSWKIFDVAPSDSDSKIEDKCFDKW